MEAALRLLVLHLLVLHPFQVRPSLVLHLLAVRLLPLEVRLRLGVLRLAVLPLVPLPLVGLAVHPERPGMELCREGKPLVLHPLVLHLLGAFLRVLHPSVVLLLVVGVLLLLRHPLSGRRLALRPLRLPVP